MTDVKRCTKCSTQKPLGAFYKDSRTRDGLTSHCKACRREAVAQHRERFPEKAKATAARSRAKNAERIAARKAMHYRRNIDRLKEYNALYYKNHCEQIKSNVARYAARHPEMCKIYAARYRERHPGKLREAHRKAYLAHPERWTAYIHNRRAALSGIKLTAGVPDEVMAASGGICPYCGKSFIKGHIDHIVPVSSGGTNARENLVYVCSKCNLRKHNKSLLEFLDPTIYNDVRDKLDGMSNG